MSKVALGGSKRLARTLDRAGILDGVLAATAAALAGPIGEGGDFEEEDAAPMQAAHDWAIRMKALLEKAR
jgi:hypothetical protein